MASLSSSSRTNARTNQRRRGARLTSGASITVGIGATLALVVACTTAPADGDDDTAGTGGTAGTSTAGHGGMNGGTGGGTNGGTTSAGTGQGGTGGATANGGSAGAGRSNGGASGTVATMGGTGGAGAPSGGAGSSTGGAPMGGMAGSMMGGGRGGRGGAGAPNGGMAGASAGMGGAAGGSAGTTSTGDYHPCPTTGDPCKILPLGDSITWGIQYDGAYRVELFTKAVGDNHKITFTGSLSNGPTTVAGQMFPKSNEGHSGWTIDQDAGLIPSPAMTTIPHIVLLHIGTNDIYASSGQSTMPDRLGKLVDKIIAAAPDALVVVAKITPLSNSSWNATIKTYNDAIPGVIKTRADAGKHVIGADMNTGFTSGMLSSDGVHPQKSGYDFMGDQFYSVIKSYLP